MSKAWISYTNNSIFDLIPFSEHGFGNVASLADAQKDH